MKWQKLPRSYMYVDHACRKHEPQPPSPCTLGRSSSETPTASLAPAYRKQLRFWASSASPSEHITYPMLAVPVGVFCLSVISSFPVTQIRSILYRSQKKNRCDGRHLKSQHLNVEAGVSGVQDQPPPYIEFDASLC